MKKLNKEFTLQDAIKEFTETKGYAPDTIIFNSENPTEEEIIQGLKVVKTKHIQKDSVILASMDRMDFMMGFK